MGVKPGEKYPVAGKIYPTNADSTFVSADSIKGDYLEDIVLSKDKKSFSCIFESAPDYLESKADTITATVANVPYDSQASNTGSLKSSIAIGTPPDKPDFGGYDYLTAYQTTATFQNKRTFASNIYMEVSLKKGKKWIKRIDSPVLGEYTVSGLKANKKYNFRARYYLEVNGVKIYSDAQAMSVKTGVTTAPSIKTLKVSGIKKHSRKVEGYWDDKGKWHKGYTLYWKDYTLKVTLKKKVASGALGLRVVGGEQRKGTGTSFTFKCTTATSSGGYPTSENVMFSFWSDKKFGGYSPSSKVFTVSLK